MIGEPLLLANFPNIANLVLTILVGYVPALALYLGWIRRLRRLSEIRQFFAFTANKPLDVVLTTSTVAESETKSTYMRPLTGIGQVVAMAAAAEAIGKYDPRKPVRAYMSIDVNELGDDLLLLGGPLNSVWSGKYLDELKAAYPSIDFAFDDRTRTIKLGTFQRVNFDLHTIDGYPTHDIGLIVCWKNPFVDRERRGILCAGFSTYGTAGAARYIFQDFLETPRHRRRRQVQGSDRPRPYFVAIVSVFVSRNQIVGLRLETSVPLN